MTAGIFFVGAFDINFSLDASLFYLVVIWVLGKVQARVGGESFMVV